MQHWQLFMAAFSRHIAARLLHCDSDAFAGQGKDIQSGACQPATKALRERELNGCMYLIDMAENQELFGHPAFKVMRTQNETFACAGAVCTSHLVDFRSQMLRNLQDRQRPNARASVEGLRMRRCEGIKLVNDIC